VEFPYLGEIGLYEPDKATSINTRDVIIHYA
jgi:hypothetical protein